MQKRKLDHQFIPHVRINSKWIKDLNVSHKIIKILEENIGISLSDISCSNIFVNRSPRARKTKEKINKWDYIKLKSFSRTKEINKMKKEPTVLENIFANVTYAKKLIYKIFKEHIQLNTRKTNNPIKRAKDINRYFSKENI